MWFPSFTNIQKVDVSFSARLSSRGPSGVLALVTGLFSPGCRTNGEHNILLFIFTPTDTSSFVREWSVTRRP